MRLSLRAGERIFVNGAVLRVDRRVAVELLNDADFLLEGHVMQADAASTPLRQLYFAVQTMLIEPARAEPGRALFGALQAGILAATGTPDLRTGLRDAQALVDAGKLFEALKLIRALYPIEAAVLTGGEPDNRTAGANVPRPGARRPRTADECGRAARRTGTPAAVRAQTGRDTEV